MIKVVGLTGGIGSGKTTVANIFEKLGVPVYCSDTVAKRILNENTSIKLDLKKHFGPQICSENMVDNKLLASIVFSDPEKLKTLNRIVHPEVKKDFQRWKASFSKSYVIREAAILFESGTHSDCDAVITVIAPLEERIIRLQKQRRLSKKEIMRRINNQWNDADKIKLSDYTIDNRDLAITREKVVQIHGSLLNNFSKLDSSKDGKAQAQ